MNISKEEFLKKYIIEENGLFFYPIIKYDRYDTENDTYINLTIVESAEDVKSEYYGIINNSQ